ncbi:hypothetical protein RM543_04035 [Roseicyclus sp. F158]|uniref:Uncharacterized protein n=1 Tax=Tropicimonas omnivorans TaxID=3075590 RepID=A0ABU3DDR0_9RHOB|nr:hypothetical protein [Roseicyclus sp. F158]MDT0681844.1 hypothetical protein [Roseicyclus sp. F158]
MTMDELIIRLDALTKRNAREIMAEIAAALEENGLVTQDVLISAAYIAGIEDAITGMDGRPEYDLRRMDFASNAKATLTETGRAIGSAASQDLISQAIEER